MSAKHQHHYRLTRPCADCPFRSDRPFFLGPGRAMKIKRDTEMYPFGCHNTVDYGNEKPEFYEVAHCAGALIMREKLRRPSLVMRLAHQVGKYDPTKLDMDAPVYDSWEAMERGTSGQQSFRDILLDIWDLTGDHTPVSLETFMENNAEYPLDPTDVEKLSRLQPGQTVMVSDHSVKIKRV